MMATQFLRRTKELGRVGTGGHKILRQKYSGMVHFHGSVDSVSSCVIFNNRYSVLKNATRVPFTSPVVSCLAFLTQTTLQ
jgi:hypothetical protein